MRNKLLLAATALLLLTACDPFAKTVSVETPLPEGLKDCGFFQVKPYKDGPTLNIVRCPLSTTSVQYPVGKSQGNAITTEAGPAGIPQADVERAVREAQLAHLQAEIARLQLKAAELEKGK